MCVCVPINFTFENQTKYLPQDNHGIHFSIKILKIKWNPIIPSYLCVLKAYPCMNLLSPSLMRFLFEQTVVYSFFSSIYISRFISRVQRFFVLIGGERISLGFSTFIFTCGSPSTGPTFHRKFSRYRARKVAKTCSRISFPSLPLRLSGGSLLHGSVRRIKLSSRKLAYYLPIAIIVPQREYLFFSLRWYRHV